MHASLCARQVTIVKPRIPVISNVDAKTHSDPEVIKQILTKQARTRVYMDRAWGVGRGAWSVGRGA